MPGTPHQATRSRSPYLALKNVLVTSEHIAVLNKANAWFPEGMSSVIMGPSGCGKSTLLKVAAGITVPDSGKVYLQGKNLFRLSEKQLLHFRKGNGFVFQDAALWANKTIQQNLALPLQFHRRDLSQHAIDRRINILLEKMDLVDTLNLRPAQLSSGEQKVVSFLRAVILEPSTLFIDEVLPSLDHVMAERLMVMIRDLKEQGCTIIAVTHDARLTSLIADHLVIMNRGRVVECGPFDSVRKSENHEVISILTEVLSEAATYETDLLDLLGGEKPAET
jgi:phospholipid/cholesterol/gamma-HCH transport system ATP-binding protein